MLLLRMQARFRGIIARKHFNALFSLETLLDKFKFIKKGAYGNQKTSKSSKIVIY
jgi:hypothetical protein